VIYSFTLALLSYVFKKKQKNFYQTSKVVNKFLILPEVHINYIVEHYTNCRLTLEGFIHYYCLPYKLDRYSFTFRYGLD